MVSTDELETQQPLTKEEERMQKTPLKEKIFGFLNSIERFAAAFSVKQIPPKKYKPKTRAEIQKRKEQRKEEKKRKKEEKERRKKAREQQRPPEPTPTAGGEAAPTQQPVEEKKKSAMDLFVPTRQPSKAEQYYAERGRLARGKEKVKKKYEDLKGKVKGVPGKAKKRLEKYKEEGKTKRFGVGRKVFGSRNIAGYAARRILERSARKAEEKEAAKIQKKAATKEAGGALIESLGARKEEPGRLTTDQIKELEERIMKNVKEQMGTGMIDPKTGKIRRTVSNVPKFCHSCGNKVTDEGQKFCEKCGSNVYD